MTSKKPLSNKIRKKSNAVVKSPTIIAANAKLRKKPHYRSFRLHPIIKHPGPELPSWYQLTKKALLLLRANILQVALYMLVYATVFFLFVRGLIAPLDVGILRDQLKQYASDISNISNNISIVGFMLHSAFNASGGTSMTYEMTFLLLSALAFIWLFRQQQAGNKVSFKDAYYRGMYPLIPFLVVCAVIALQAAPAIIGSTLYGAVVRDKLAITSLEQVFWFLFFMLLIVLSLYLISMSFVALFIVTLPEMTPMVAFKEAHALVQYRRITVLFRVIALLFVLAGAYVALVFPAIFVSSALSQALFFLLTLFILPFSVAYLYIMYRELL